MNKIKLALIVAVMLVFSTNVNAQSKKEIRKAKELAIATQVDSLISNLSITIEIDRIVPMSGRSINSIDGYKLSIKQDSVKTYLPYFGKSTNIPFSGDLSIDIEESSVEIIREQRKKNELLSFVCFTKKDHERCEFTVEIMKNGYATIRLIMNSRNPITYHGQLKEINY